MNISDREEEEILWTRESFLYMKMLANRCGIDLDGYKKQIIHHRLVRQIRLAGLEDFDSYCSLLKNNPELESQFFNLITNATTSFFRENHHFDYLATKVLPDLMKGKKIRIWSAGCSTGEEAYSIAMILYETIPDLEKYDIKILATDINTNSLNQAQTGIFTESSLENISFKRKITWFEPIQHKGNYKIDDRLKKLIVFKQINLMDSLPMSNPFNVIFCRNVLIYFKKDMIKKILHALNGLLEENDVLFLGHSENLQDLRKLFVHEGKTIFRKKAGLQSLKGFRT